MSQKLNLARMEAIWGLFIGDAVAMPVHWYYRPLSIKTDYGGWLKGYRAPNLRHPSSILNLSAVDGSGRKGGKQSTNIIGSVILHDKLKYWVESSGTTHYHQGMSAGDNTLNAVTALETLETLEKIDPNGTGNLQAAKEAVMENYVRFMTTPGSHNDTYAESFHRSFFSDWIRNGKPTSGKDIVNFALKRYQAVSEDREDHQLAVIGALVLVIPWVIHYAERPEKEVVQLAADAVTLTHPCPSLQPYVMLYAQMLYKVLHGANVQETVLAAAANPVLGRPNKAQVIPKFSTSAARHDMGSEQRLVVYQEAAAILGMACYIQGALSTMMLLAYEFHKDFNMGVLMNANCGGENVHRGAALSALLAAGSVYQSSNTVDQKWKDELSSLRSRILQLERKKLSTNE